MPKGIYKRIIGINCGFRLGKHHSYETKQKIGKSNKRNMSEETKYKLRLCNLGKKLSEETKKKISKTMKDKKINVGKDNPLYGKKPWNNNRKEIRVEVLQKLSDSHKGQVSWNKNKPMFHMRGANHPFWKGGISPLNVSIREIIENRKWIREVLERDCFACQECFLETHNVVAHHIKPFSIILSEFLKEYSQFSPIEDKEILMRLSITYKPFWDTNNGKTLCKECHDIVTRKQFKEIFNQ